MWPNCDSRRWRTAAARAGRKPRIGADGGTCADCRSRVRVGPRDDCAAMVRSMNVAPFRPTQVRIALASRPDAPAHGSRSRPRSRRAGRWRSLALEAACAAMVARARRGRPYSIDVTATLAPFAAWLLATLEACGRRRWTWRPCTARRRQRRSAAARPSRPTQRGRPAGKQVAIRSPTTAPAASTTGRLPVRRAADLRARPDDPTRGEIHALDIVLGSAAPPAGSDAGQRPADAGTGAAYGPVGLAISAARARRAGAGDNISGQATSTSTGAATPAAARAASARLKWPLPAAACRWTGRTRPSRWKSMRPRQGNASSCAGPRCMRRDRASCCRAPRVQPAGRSEWQIDGSGSLHDFDPAVWWPGPEGSAWRKGPHRLNGTLSAAQAPAAVGGTDSWQQLALVHGRAALRARRRQPARRHGRGRRAVGRRETAARARHPAVSSSIGGSRASRSLSGRIAADGANHWEIEARRAELSPWAALAD